MEDGGVINLGLELFLSHTSYYRTYLLTAVYSPTSALEDGDELNLGIELDCAFGVVDRWAKAKDLGYPQGPEDDDESAEVQAASEKFAEKFAEKFTVRSKPGAGLQAAAAAAVAAS